MNAHEFEYLPEDIKGVLASFNEGWDAYKECERIDLIIIRLK